jgi:hypothetical protein
LSITDRNASKEETVMKSFVSTLSAFAIALFLVGCGEPVVQSETQTESGVDPETGVEFDAHAEDDGSDEEGDEEAPAEEAAE